MSESPGIQSSPTVNNRTNSVRIPPSKIAPKDLQIEKMPGLELVYSLEAKTFTFATHRELLAIIKCYPNRFETIPIPRWTARIRLGALNFRKDGAEGVSNSLHINREIELPLKVVFRKAMQKDMYGRLWITEQ